MEQEVKRTENAELVKMMQGMYENQLVLAGRMGVELPFSLDEWLDNINKVCEASEVKEIELPLKLARKIKNREAWDMAVREGYVTMGDDGKLQWQLGTKTLLAYFLGRVFCGDRGKWSKRRGCYVWEQGEGEFPEKDIERLFGKSNVRIIRENQRKCNLPKMHQIVDKLFDTLNLSNI